MSSNSKEFPYELFRQMHNDLQSQMMKMTQISRTETPASGMANVAATNNQTVILQRPGPTAVQVNTYTNKKMATTSNGKAVVVQQPEKKTFEQAYREAIERLKAAASGKPDSPGQSRQQQQIVTALGSGKIQQHRQIAASPGNSATIVNSNNRFPAVEPSTSTYSSPSSSSRSAESQYKTTIYNINTINLAGLLKNQSNPNEVRSNDRESAAASRPSIPNVSSQSAARVMDESNRYRETFANAYARHLLELTRTAVEKKTAISTTQNSSSVGLNSPSSSTSLTVVKTQAKPFIGGQASRGSPYASAELPPKKSRPTPSASARNPMILNGRDGTVPTYAEVVSASGGKTNGNVMLKIDRKPMTGVAHSNLPSLDVLMAAHSSKTKIAPPTSQDKQLLESRLKPSSIQVNHEELYRHLQGKAMSTSHPAVQQRSTSVTPKPVTSRQQSVIVSNKLPVPNVGHRPDLTIIVNKPKISSPAPSVVYGKPTISTPKSTSSTGQSVSPAASTSYSMGLSTPKRDQLPVMAEPPPAHSATPKPPYVSPSPAIPKQVTPPGPIPTRDPPSYASKSSTSITPKFGNCPSSTPTSAKSTFATPTSSTPALERALNLDTKVATPPPSTSHKSAGYDGYGLQMTTSSALYRSSGDRSSLLYNAQKPVKIEKRVNYDPYTTSRTSHESSASKYQHNVIWKEQPAIKTEDQLKGKGSINEQKRTLLELLQTANMQQQMTSQSQNQAKGLGNMIRTGVSPVTSSIQSGGSGGTAAVPFTVHKNHSNHMSHSDLLKYRMERKNFVKDKPRKPIDPLAIKPDPDRPEKRKEPPKRLDWARRKKLKRSTEPYLQNGPCYEVAPRLSRCRECGRSAASRLKDSDTIFCRFIAFRKLKYNQVGHMEVAGFADPTQDAQKADISLWDANLSMVPIDLSVEKSKFLLGQVGYKFCELFHQEKEAYFEHMSEDKTIAWKQAVQGVREMCDVCSTTLFNYHWVCSTCGFVVCIDCYKYRKYNSTKNDTGTRDRDCYMWLHCTNREPHVQNKLMLTQIIPANSLYKLVRQMHGVCALLEIPLNCECPLSKESLFRKIKDRLEFIFPITIEVERKSDETDKGSEGDANQSLVPACSSTTKMVSITIKDIQSTLSESDSGTVCCKVIFGRELSGDKNPEIEKLKLREKQSYTFEGFQMEIKKESLDDFIKKDDEEVEEKEEGKVSIKEEKIEEETKKVEPETSVESNGNNKEVEDKENAEVKPSVEELKDAEPVGDIKKVENADPLESVEKDIKQEKNSDDPAVKPVLRKDSSTESEPPYSEDDRFKSSPKLDFKTFNMIVKQLLKFDKSLNISGLFENHLSEKCSESESLVDFTAEFQLQHSNIQSFLNDFLSEFVFLTGQNSTDNLTDDVQIMEYNRYMKKGIEFQNKGERVMTLKESEKLYPNVAHQWLCNGRLLRLLDPLNDNNYNTFHDQWERGQPVMVSYVSDKLDMSLWRPESFIRDFGENENDLINCLNGKLVRGQKMKVFWEGFERVGFRLMDDRDRPMMLKLKDWPPGDDFAEMMPTRFSDLMNNLPLSEYTRREGRLNLASRLSSFFVRPDLGPKMYSAYGSALHPTKGTTNLHLDVSDAVNVMVYTAVPKDVERTKYVQKVLDAIDSDECDVFTRQRIRDKADLPGALWHIYHAKDADKIRSLLNKIEVERGGSIKANHDPIHDQKWYLDANLRRRLLQEYNVEGYSIVQCSGDAIFIPAGAPHQVRNLHNCVKVAEDFVSPENISYCFKLTNEFRHLTNTHSNHEDKLQIKNIIYHTVKDAVSCLTNPLIMTKEKIDLV
nr:lysine-specific demethylase 3A-like isoform X2 [Aedes albopictus]